MILAVLAVDAVAVELDAREASGSMSAPGTSCGTSSTWPWTPREARRSTSP